MDSFLAYTTHGMQWDIPYSVCTALRRHLVTIILVICLCKAPCTVAGSSDVNYTINVLEDLVVERNGGEINHLVVHEITGKVYLGAVNSIYQLTEYLALELTETTGPMLDTPNCRPGPEQSSCCQRGRSAGSNCDEDFIPKPTDSVNKALLIDYDNSRLVTCSNLRQGHCEKRWLSNISETDLLDFIPVVNFDLHSPVVMYTAPGLPTKYGPTNKALYVASTYSTVGDLYRDMVPSISSRNLSNFTFLYTDILTTGTKLTMLGDKENFRINYKTGFSSGGFSYFLAVQPDSSTNPVRDRRNVTKMMRVCQDDDKFMSYVEMPLRCFYNGVEYNILEDAEVLRPASRLAQALKISHLDQNHLDDVMFAVFTRGGTTGSSGSVGGGGGGAGDSTESALCMYPLRYVRQMFTKAIKDCFNGIGNTGPAHFRPVTPCDKQTIVIDDDYCGTEDINNPISGSESGNHIDAQAVLVLPVVKATSIAMTTTTNFTVAFIGTASGQLKKVALETETRAVAYETVVVQQGVPVNQDLILDRWGTHVYAATGNRVSRIKVQECRQYTTCEQCLQANDPYCGWCSLENKCSLQTECRKADQPLQWLDYAGTQCTRILNIMPSQVPMEKDTHSSTQRLVLTVQNLPLPYEGSYECSFTGPGITPRQTPAVRQGAAQYTGNSTLQCDTPAYNLLPNIPTGEDHIPLKLSVRMDNRDFVSKDFTFFDCSRHDSCTECTRSAFPCTWCVRAHKCTFKRDSCDSDMLVTGRNVPGISDTPGPDFCPRIESSLTEILVPNGEQKEVEVKATNLQEFQKRELRCVFSMPERSIEREVNATFDEGSGTIRCDSVPFSYRTEYGSSQTEYLKIPFRIFWGRRDRNILDNPDNIQVVVYKCELMASSCGECLTRPSHYQCGWCGALNNCTIQKHCTNPGSWLMSSNPVCPNPVITEIEPRYGPLVGGTSLTIHGTNLGIIFDDVRGGITIGNVQCIGIEEKYVPAKTITCETSATEERVSEPVEVVIKNQLTTRSLHNFNFVNPTLLDFYPKEGPRSGGTLLTIHGEFLNVGSQRHAQVMGQPCSILNTTELMTLCVTPQLSAGIDNRTPADVTMTIDRANIRLTPPLGGAEVPRFVYVPDPEVYRVAPAKTLPSGGTNVQVEGRRFDIIQHPRLSIYHNGHQNSSECRVQSPESMICTTPGLASLENAVIDPEMPLSLSYGFLLDNVTSLRNVTRLLGGVLLVYPMPEFESFPEEGKILQGDGGYLTINGRNLNLVLTEGDITVLIGELKCNVTSVSLTQLNCLMPSHKLFRDSKQDIDVVIQAGHLRVPIGTVKFEGSGNTTITGLPLMFILIAASAVAVLLFLVISVGVFAYRKQAREGGRAQKRLQSQMDQREARVAKECKEAFAELQTEMTDIRHALASHEGIPYRPYQDFAMKMLFPHTVAQDHPVIMELEPTLAQNDGVQKGLAIFNTMVENRYFLLAFVRTLEAHNDFGMLERVKVASLISVALQNRMEFYTEILKQLLKELIDKSMESKKNPKLLLRRTESVAEKLLANWFNILLHKFLMECAGEPLFMLYRAIKLQVYKGPVDQVTAEARYSLAEDKLLRQHVDYKCMTLRVVDPYNGGRETPVKVLDCDTITQAKEKIHDALYRNRPFSDRPDIGALELEWQPGSTGRLILKDEDRVSKRDGANNQRRLNTLAFYNVQDNALVALVPKQSSLNNISGLPHTGSHHYISANYRDSPSLNRSMSPESRVIDLDITSPTKAGQNVYHLVKTPDAEDTKEGQKMVSEIYLTRLLTTKMTLQQFVDDLFRKLFNVESHSSSSHGHRNVTHHQNGRHSSTGHESALYTAIPTSAGSSVPLPIKYMFDFLDDESEAHGVSDPEVVHTWKSNSLPLRFFVNMVKNPDFVFDIHKSSIVDSCLSVVAQTLMDSCSLSENKLGKDSPTCKLLYAKDLPQYKEWVRRYYQHIKQMPAISDQDMNTLLAEESRAHAPDFHTDAALFELYSYVEKYYKELLQCLADDKCAISQRLAQKLEQVRYHMSSDL